MQKTMGRPPRFGEAMTAAHRQRRHRDGRKDRIEKLERCVSKALDTMSRIEAMIAAGEHHQAAGVSAAIREMIETEFRE